MERIRRNDLGRYEVYDESGAYVANFKTYNAAYRHAYGTEAPDQPPPPMTSLSAHRSPAVAEVTSVTNTRQGTQAARNTTPPPSSSNRQSFVYGLLGGLVAVVLAIAILLRLGVIAGSAGAVAPARPGYYAPSNNSPSYQQPNQRTQFEIDADKWEQEQRLRQLQEEAGRACNARGGLWTGASCK